MPGGRLVRTVASAVGCLVLAGCGPAGPGAGGTDVPDAASTHRVAGAPASGAAGASGTAPAPWQAPVAIDPPRHGVATADTTTSTVDPWDVEPVAPPYSPTPAVLSAPAPVRLVAPGLGVDVGLVALGVLPDGSMEVPVDARDAGWFTGGPRPGETGPSVIAGHVDSRTGPAVFARLGELVPGDEVAVLREDGSTAVFRVTGSQEVLKAEFPTDVIFGPTDRQELRLITCGGEFDSQTQRYRSNLIVFAELDRIA
jgi:hypothetical protein